MHTPRSAAAAVALLAVAASCGTTGSITPRPIETLIYVSGGPSLSFGFASTPNPRDCGSSGTGIQSPNASHQFGARIFQTPHLFVLENIRQPVRAVIQNLDSVPIRIDIYLGQTPQNSNVIINPGQCQSVVTNEVMALPTPMPIGPEIRVEVCAPIPLTTKCVDDGMPPPTPPADRNLAYFATIGDVAATNITNCSLPPILDACRSPTTFFLEQPHDQVDAVMSVNPGQNPGGTVPTAELRLELYVNGTNEDNDAGTEPAVTKTL